MVILTPQHALDTQTETLGSSQYFQQEMEQLWDSLNLLPDGQKPVVLHQLMQLGTLPLHPSPHEFPALAIHGYLVEKMVDGQTVWQTCSPHLKEFGRLGISASFRHGYTLYPHHIFSGNLQATIMQSQRLQDYPPGISRHHRA